MKAMNKPLDIVVLSSFSKNSTTFKVINLNTEICQDINLFETASFDFFKVLSKVCPTLSRKHIPRSQWWFDDLTECYMAYSKYLLNLVEFAHIKFDREDNMPIHRVPTYFPNTKTHAKIINTYFEHCRSK